MKKILKSYSCRGVMILFFLLLAACNADVITAPNESTIEVSPLIITVKGLSGDSTFNLYALLKDKDGLPINNAKIRISGAFASPRSPARYFFYTSVDAGGTQVNSGFDCITNAFGQCGFSIVIPAEVSNTANLFIDDVQLSSGSASKNVKISITAATT